MLPGAVVNDRAEVLELAFLAKEVRVLGLMRAGWGIEVVVKPCLESPYPWGNEVEGCNLPDKRIIV